MPIERSRSNQTHRSTTDPDSPLVQESQGHEAKLAYLGELLMENRHGLVVDACVVPATGIGERDAAINLVADLAPRRVAVGGDKGYDMRSFIETLRQLEVYRRLRSRVVRDGFERHAHPEARTSRARCSSDTLINCAGSTPG